MAKNTWLRLERSCRSETPSCFCKIPVALLSLFPASLFLLQVPAQATLPPPTQNASLMLSCMLVLGWVSQTQRWQTAALGDIDIHEKSCEGPQPRHPGLRGGCLVSLGPLSSGRGKRRHKRTHAAEGLSRASFLLLWCWIEMAGDRELHL